MMLKGGKQIYNFRNDDSFFSQLLALELFVSTRDVSLCCILMYIKNDPCMWKRRILASLCGVGTTGRGWYVLWRVLWTVDLQLFIFCFFLRLFLLHLQLFAVLFVGAHEHFDEVEECWDNCKMKRRNHVLYMKICTKAVWLTNNNIRLICCGQASMFMQQQQVIPYV